MRSSLTDLKGREGRRGRRSRVMIVHMITDGYLYDASVLTNTKKFHIIDSSRKAEPSQHVSKIQELTSLVFITQIP